MYFKLSYTIRNFWLHNDEEVFDMGNGSIQIRLYKFPSEGNDNSLKQTACCELIYEFNPGRKALETCRKIISHEDLGIAVTDTRGIRYTRDNYFLPHIDSFPQSFKEFYAQLKSDMNKIVRAFISNAMWICNHNGAHDPLALRDFELSDDRKQWMDMPIDLRVTSSIGDFPIRFSEKGRQIVSSKLESAPIHHSLFLEAWSQRNINKRSSLIMALAALESSVKYTFVKIVPDAVWVIDNSPSPSVQKMITEMIKTLPIKNKIDNEIKSLSKETTEELKKWVLVRNTLMHKGSGLPKTFNIEQILKTIKSIIYLMDYYSGEEWAIVYVNRKILEP